MREEGGSLEYVPFYCEENVRRGLFRMEGRKSWVVLAFGRGSSFAMLRQRAGRPGDGLVLWDYHVFALVKERADGAKIVDFDTDLGLETDAEIYLDASFGGVEEAGGYAPIFRVVDGGEYSRRLYSDRSHMRAPDGSWLAPPPPWPYPGLGLPEDERWPLADLIDPEKPEPPSLFDLSALRRFVGSFVSNRSLS